VIAAADVASTSITADFVIGAVLVVIGGVLAFDVKGISATLLRNSAISTPWTRRFSDPSRPNTFRVIGWIFFCFGIFTLVATLIHVA
jgi:hypothetical protein